MSNKQITVLTTFFIFLLFGFSEILYASPSATIIGTIKDSTTGETLIGANIIVVGTSLGGSTDFKWEV